MVWISLLLSLCTLSSFLSLVISFVGFCQSLVIAISLVVSSCVCVISVGFGTAHSFPRSLIFSVTCDLLFNIFSDPFFICLVFERIFINIYSFAYFSTSRMLTSFSSRACLLHTWSICCSSRLLPLSSFVRSVCASPGQRSLISQRTSVVAPPVLMVFDFRSLFWILVHKEQGLVMTSVPLISLCISAIRVSLLVESMSVSCVEAHLCLSGDHLAGFQGPSFYVLILSGNSYFQLHIKVTIHKNFVVSQLSAQGKLIFTIPPSDVFLIPLFAEEWKLHGPAIQRMIKT
jgi:hypothetical protein